MRLSLAVTLQIVVTCLADTAAIAAEVPAGRLLCAGAQGLRLIQVQTAEQIQGGEQVQAGEQTEPQPLWSWNPQTAVGLTDEQRRAFSHLDECKPLDDARGYWSHRPAAAWDCSTGQRGGCCGRPA